MLRSFRPLVLCYHAASDRWPHALSIPAETIERQVAWVRRRGFHGARAEDVVDGRRRVVHVTFDDAYRSIETVLPALERLGAPVTVFACSGYASDGRPLAIAELADDAARYPDELATMDWDALRSLVDRGVEIGSHTVSHAHLTQLGDDELMRELTESKVQIEDMLGRPCRFVAYPYGDDDARVYAAARDAGYLAGFALPGRERPIDPHALPRVGIYRADSQLRVTMKTTAVVRRPAAALLRATGRLR